MLIRDEMGRRFGDAARIEYVDLSDMADHAEDATVVAQIERQGLLYPVTVIDGDPVYDGAVSYPAIIRAVGAKLNPPA